MSSDAAAPVLAIFYQAGPPPNFGGVFKPPKDGGYRDSCADIAFALRKKGVKVLVPVKDEPDVMKHGEWCFPDTTDGIEAALKAGADTLWLNTVLHRGHPAFHLPTPPPPGTVKYIHQLPSHAERYDDKAWVNEMLRNKEIPGAGGKTLREFFPKAWVVEDGKGWPNDLTFPIVVKPIRGRGSHGVSVAKSQEELDKQGTALFAEGSSILLEEFLSGEEVTITILPPGSYDPPLGEQPTHPTLPVVVRTNHINLIAPYNGVQAVALNSRSLSSTEEAADPTYAELRRNCALVGDTLGTRGIIRIDARRGEGGGFRLFDINMKPNITGPGRPGRENQTSLMGLAAEKIGWDYTTLLLNMIKYAVPLEEGVEDAKS